MPLLPVTAIKPGWHDATLEGFTFRPSSKGNPMVEVEVTLDTGELTSFYLLVTFDGAGYFDFLRAAGEAAAAASLRRHPPKVPDIDLDDLIGRHIQILIPDSGFISQFRASDANQT